MAQVVMSPNPKVIRKFINQDGTVIEGTIDQALGAQRNNLAGTTSAGTVSGGSQAITEPKKVCLECSSLAEEGLDYCAFCYREINKK